MKQTDRPLWRGRTNVSALVIAQVEFAESLRTGANKGKPFVITQGSFQAGAGDLNSAGTHDLDGVIDIRWTSDPHDIWCLRTAGLLAWHRTPAMGPWPDHIHCVSLLCAHERMARAAVDQIVSWQHGKNGLASNGPDDGPKFTVQFTWGAALVKTPNITKALEAPTLADRRTALEAVVRHGDKQAATLAQGWLDALDARDAANEKGRAAKAALRKLERK